jgi:hypothetical protein
VEREAEDAERPEGRLAPELPRVPLLRDRLEDVTDLATPARYQ